MFVRTASAAAAAVALLVTSGAAIAGAPAKQAASVDVSYGDLDLASNSGERRLKDRIRMAASRICGGYGARDLVSIRQFQDCRGAAITAANQDVTRAVAAARGTGPALASSSGGSIRISRANTEK